MCMRPRRESGLYDNTAPTDDLELTAEVQRWTGVRTAGHITPTLRTPLLEELTRLGVIGRVATELE